MERAPDGCRASRGSNGIELSRYILAQNGQKVVMWSLSTTTEGTRALLRVNISLELVHTYGRSANWSVVVSDDGIGS